MKIVTIIGARPQFIKSACLSRKIAEIDGLEEVTIHTGQHYDDEMSGIFFRQMRMKRADYHLDIHGERRTEVLGETISAIGRVLEVENPDRVVVYGDTDSTLAGAISASKSGVELVHIEAGLRSGNRSMPEEINRVVTDAISDILITPTLKSLENLEREGSPDDGRKRLFCGDIMLECSRRYRKYARKPDIRIGGDFILCTVHRAGNTDDPERLRSIFRALETIGESAEIVMPLHPRSSLAMERYGIDTKIETVAPVGYLEMLWLLEHCSMVITDSGGLQREAYFFKKPCIVLRDETEWIELTEGGYTILAGSDSDKIVEAFKSGSFSSSYDEAIFGDGDISGKIVDGVTG
jgi:UDP-GlcNAc3NAcA epimerase